MWKNGATMRRLIYVLILLAGCTDREKPQEIERLDQEIDQYEKKALEEEVHSMGAFRSNYSKFVHELEKSEQSEEKVRELERERANFE